MTQIIVEIETTRVYRGIVTGYVTSIEGYTNAVILVSRELKLNVITPKVREFIGCEPFLTSLPLNRCKVIDFE